MAFALPSRVFESYTTTGTGTITLNGAVAGYRTFASALSNGDTLFYFLQGGSDWEIGYGTYTGGTLARTTVLKSSNSNNAVSWQEGTKYAGIAPIGLSDLDATNLGRYVDLLGAFDLIGLQVFTGNGTYTPVAGMKYCIVEGVGGGGGGGGGDSNTTTQNSVGAGGAGGTYSRKKFTASDVGASKAVAVGAAGAAGSAGNNAGGSGGTTTFGSTLLTAPGGGGGGSGANTSGSLATGGGAPGAAGTGDVSIPGEPGKPGIQINTSSRAPGMGGNSVLGGGGASNVSNSSGNSSAGSAGGNYGGGGSGGRGSTSATAAGGAGAPGVLIVWEFA